MNINKCYANYDQERRGVELPRFNNILEESSSHIQPEKDIVVEFIKNEEFKYVRALGATYMRLVGTSLDCYKYLEPLFNDSRKLRRQNRQGQFELVYIDEYIDELLREERLCDIILPRIQKRHVLEENNELESKISALEDDLDEGIESSGEEEEIAKPADIPIVEENHWPRNREEKLRRSSPTRRRSTSRERNRDRERRRSRDRERNRSEREKKPRRGSRERRHKSPVGRVGHRDREHVRAAREARVEPERERRREREQDRRFTTFSSVTLSLAVGTVILGRTLDPLVGKWGRERLVAPGKVPPVHPRHSASLGARFSIITCCPFWSPEDYFCYMLSECPFWSPEDYFCYCCQNALSGLLRNTSDITLELIIPISPSSFCPKSVPRGQKTVSLPCSTKVARRLLFFLVADYKGLACLPRTVTHSQENSSLGLLPQPNG
uniref:Pre-mRNA-splicing factor 38 n=1 Tax=Timema bartmani TaxID=61472 RepID=A0A7R9ENS6_9NEOP|nr:unnamed protein product [Timema bartmani]